MNPTVNSDPLLTDCTWQVQVHFLHCTCCHFYRLLSLFLSIDKRTMSRKRKYEDEVAGFEAAPLIAIDSHIEIFDDDTTISTASSVDSSSSSDSSTTAGDSLGFLHVMLLWFIMIDDDDERDIFMLLLLAQQQGYSARVLTDAVMAMMRNRLS
jgi:hypothetical protein